MLNSNHHVGCVRVKCHSLSRPMKPQSHTSLGLVLTLVVGQCAVLMLVGCGGQGSTGEQAEDEAPPDDLSCDIPQLFEDRCGSAACHSGETAAAGLDLVSPGVEDRVSGVSGTNCQGLLADPADPES